MNVDIYIRERDGNREIRIPWLPEKIEFESGGTVRASYDIMNKGPVEVPMGSGLCAYSWESQFPGKYRTNDTSMFRGSWKNPTTYHNILEDWKAKGTPLCLLVTGYPINKDVYLDDYHGHASGGFGDIEYTVSFIESREITISSTKVSNSGSNTKRSTSETSSYTVKSGDTLWAIAEKYLGDGSKWKLIYDANKEIIESTATSRWKAAGINRDSQNGHWIFPGTVLTIPSAGAVSATSASTTTNTTPSAGGGTSSKSGSKSGGLRKNTSVSVN